MQFNLATNEAKVLLEKLCCANGIQISLDGNHLVVSEGSSFRVIVVDIEKKEIVKTVNLPCKFYFDIYFFFEHSIIVVHFFHKKFSLKV